MTDITGPNADPNTRIVIRGKTQEQYRQVVQQHLLARTTLEAADALVRWPVEWNDDFVECAATDSFVEDWPAFRLAVQAGDEVWSFKRSNVYGGFGTGEKGFALVREGRVMKYYVIELWN
jgi:hypothetical protein